jgi:putative membrane protein
MKTRFIVITSALLLIAACSTNTNMTSSSTIPVPGLYSDSDIAAIVTNANQGEIDQAQVALTKASSPEVRAFAQMMITDHGNALTQARDLFSRKNITATDNDVSRNLVSNSQQTITAVSSYNGSEFDRQYIQSQVDVHQWLLNTLDQTLIPSAQNRDLRTFLQTQRTAVATHLDRARQILSGLNR